MSGESAPAPVQLARSIEHGLGYLFTWTGLALLYLGPFILAFLLAYYRPFAFTDVYLAAAIALLPFLATINR